MTIALTGARLFDGEQFLDNHALLIDNTQIERICPMADVPKGIAQQNLNGGTLAPGFIDLQVNGGGGVLFNNAPELATLQTMLDAHRRGGTTALLPTVITDHHQTQLAATQAIKAAKDISMEGILGIHIEGPFFSEARRGVHQESLIRPPQQQDIDWLASLPQTLKPLNVMVTLAPEQTLAGQIKQLHDAKVKVCAGHSNANYEDVQRALDEGLSGFTHLFNAMSPMTGREPGMVGTALADRNSWCGIICDGHHVHPTSVMAAFQAKPRGKLYLVTDAMATTGSQQSSFELYGETISEDNGRLVNAEGRLAGSAISMMDAVRLATESVGIPLEESLRMASLYPAQMMNHDHQRGRLKPGYRADIVHFCDDYRVNYTWLAGESQHYSSTKRIPS